MSLFCLIYSTHCAKLPATDILSYAPVSIHQPNTPATQIVHPHILYITYIHYIRHISYISYIRYIPAPIRLLLKKFPLSGVILSNIYYL